MTEILTESFCERCGTRYTFESARPRARLKGVKTLSRGLKNFVLSDDTSIDEAMAAARSESDREASSHQLDAFHKTFSFCMSCRQYTCPNCWNETEARCLSCAPLAVPEIAADVHVHDLADFRRAALTGEGVPVNGTSGLEPATAAADTWPAVTEVEPVEELELDAESPIEQAAVAEIAAVPPVLEEPLEVEPFEAAAPVELLAPVEAIGATDDTVPEADGPAGKAASQTLGLLRRFRPGQSLDAELDAFERERGDSGAAELPVEPMAAVDDVEVPRADAVAADSIEIDGLEVAAHVDAASPTEEPAPEAAAVLASEPEPEQPESEPEPEQPASIQPEPEPEAPPLAAAAASDVVEQPTWRITAPDPTGAPSTPPRESDGSVPLQAGTVPKRPASGEPQWPARPEWPNATPTAGLPFLGRPATPQGGIDALWAASNQELVTAAPSAQGKAASGIQPCISCGLSLSATARFCRRCGTLQGR